MKFSVIFRSTSLFSLKSSNATNSGAMSLFLPSPYSIKMAILNQAITVGGDLEKLSIKKSKEFEYIRDAKIEYYIPKGSCFTVNNSFIKILKLKEDKRNKKQREEGVEFEPGFSSTVSFREYVHIHGDVELIFDVKNEEAKSYLKQYLHRINYFGKKGCFFQFINYSDEPSSANVQLFSSENLQIGLIEEYDDFDTKATFENVDNFSSKTTKREKLILTLPIENFSSSKSFSCYRVI